MTHREKLLTLGLAAALVVATVAGAAAFIKHDDKQEVAAVTTTKTTKVKTAKQDLPWRNEQQPAKRAQQPQQVASNQPRCNDGNILGTLAGGVAGGVLGSTVGNGHGKTAATIAGTVGGAYLGNEYIPLDGSTCR